jgi:hypothetical protein
MVYLTMIEIDKLLERHTGDWRRSLMFHWLEIVNDNERVIEPDERLMQQMSIEHERKYISQMGAFDYGRVINL